MASNEAVLHAAANVVLAIAKMKKRRRRSCSTREWILRRQQHGASTTLLSDLLIEDKASYHNHLEKIFSIGNIKSPKTARCLIVPVMFLKSSFFSWYLIFLCSVAVLREK